ncbi:hypothetical protein [Laceyella putida]|uniref:Uncharacterized protein n=1 Tax=Laceyella putida TaxID=110101 RepID=A0ABW2RLW4_9BACL
MGLSSVATIANMSPQTFNGFLVNFVGIPLVFVLGTWLMARMGRD